MFDVQVPKVFKVTKVLGELRLGVLNFRHFRHFSTL